MKVITDDEIMDAVNAIDNDDELALKKAIRTTLLALVDTRKFIRKIYQDMPKKSKVYKKPTNNSGDVIVGR